MDRIHPIAAVLFLLALFPAASLAEEWSRFHGPNGSGVSKDTNFPAEFSKEKNLLWRTPVRAGKSSPILTRRHVFITSFENGKLITGCYDRETGRLLWERSEDRRHTDMANLLNHPAAITPVTDGANVYVLFKDFGLISYDASGKLRWKVPLGPFSNVMGLGASPIIAGDSVVVLADQVDGLSYIAAFDRRNGEIRWKKKRDEGEGWGTPLVYPSSGKAPLVITTSRGQFGAYVPANGERTMNRDDLATTIVASPVLDGDTLFVFGYGSETPAPFAGRLSRYDKNHDGQLSPDEYGTEAFIHGIGKFVGNRDLIVTKEEWDEKQGFVIGPNRLQALRFERAAGPAPATSLALREVWRYDKNFTGVIPSAVLYDGVLYIVRNGGILTAFDAATGKVLKTGRVEGALGGYSASLVAADGKLFLASEEGKVTVLRAGADWSVLAVNDLGESCYATPALSGGRIYLRSADALYAFGTAPQARKKP
jgi:outer membrane protein assembly factor BamB